MSKTKTVTPRQQIRACVKAMLHDKDRRLPVTIVWRKSRKGWESVVSVDSGTRYAFVAVGPTAKTERAALVALARKCLKMARAAIKRLRDALLMYDTLGGRR